MWMKAYFQLQIKILNRRMIDFSLPFLIGYTILPFVFVLLSNYLFEKTVIISSHIFSTLSDICDEIYLMKNGEIIRKVEQADFNKLENEMKEFTIGNRIDKLELK